MENHLFNAISDIVGFFLPSVGATMRRKRDEKLEEENPKIVATTIRDNLNKAASKARSMGNEALSKFNSMLNALPYASSPLMASVISDSRRKVTNAIKELEREQTGYETQVEGIKDRAETFNQLDADVRSRRANTVDAIEQDMDKAAKSFENKIKEIEKHV